MGKRHTILDLIRSTPSGGFCVCRDGFIVSLDRDITDHEGNGRESLPDLHFMTSLRFGAFKEDLRRRVEEGSLDPDTPVSQETWRLFSDMLASASQRHVGNPFAQLALFLPCSLAASLFWGCVLDTFFTVSGRVKVVAGFDLGSLICALVVLLACYAFYNRREIGAWVGELAWERSRKVRGVLKGGVR